MALSVNANGDVPDGKIIFAEFERAMIAERARAGMGGSKARESTAVVPATKRAVRASLAKGKGICSTARDHGVGVATVQRIKLKWLNRKDR